MTKLRALPDDLIDRLLGEAEAGVVLPDEATASRLTMRTRKVGDELVESPVPSPRNVQTVLMHDPRWQGMVWLDEFTGATNLGEREIADTDETRLQIWLDEVYGLMVSRQTIGDVLQLVAVQNQRHPVREWLEQLQWDGTERVDGWLVDYVGAEDAALVRAYGRKFMIAAVARIYQPGCKVDNTLILVGAQGARKSSTFRALAGDRWFNDSAIDIRSKDAYISISGVWINEFGELDSFQRREATTVKAFLSSTVDKFRPPYGKRDIKRPRQLVFVGTTNRQEFLSDPTGSRRFWPVAVGQIDLEAIARDREQLWAEAVKLYKAGETWWLDEHEDASRLEDAEGYSERDAWSGKVEEWLLGRTSPFTTTQALAAIGKEPVDCHRGDLMRMAGVLTSIGCSKVRTVINGKRLRMWSK